MIRDRLRDFLAGQRRLIVLGQGIENSAVTAFLAAEQLPFELIKSVDGNIKGKYQPGDLVIKAPGIPMRFASGTGAAVTTAASLFLEAAGEKTVGITGTKGKSTSTTLLAHILASSGRRVELIGNMGVPCFGRVSQCDAAELLCFELSSFQLEPARVGPRWAAVTCLFEEHLDQHGSLEAYYRAKGRIAAVPPGPDGRVLAAHAGTIAELSQAGVPVSRLVLPVEELWPAPRVQEVLRASALYGDYHVRNCQVVFPLAELLGASGAEIAASVATFRPLPHRQEIVAAGPGGIFIEDLLASVPGAVPESAATVFARLRRRVDLLVLGGVDRGCSLAPLGPLFASGLVGGVGVFGEFGQKAQRLARQFKLPYWSGENVSEVLSSAFAKAAPGVVLFAPGSPGRGADGDYAVRSAAFRAWIAAHGPPLG